MVRRHGAATVQQYLREWMSAFSFSFGYVIQILIAVNTELKQQRHLYKCSHYVHLLYLYLQNESC